MTQASGAAETAARITRPRFAQVPIALLEACADRKGTLFVYSWLWHYAGQNDQAFPSIARLAMECRMKEDHVRLSLRWLVENGWISRVDRVGHTALFHVRYEQAPPPKGGLLPQKGDPPKRGPHPSPKRGIPPLPQKGDPNKRDLTRGTEQELEPPLPPSGGSAREDHQETIPAEPLTQIAAVPSTQEGGIVAEPPPPPKPKPVKPRKPKFQPSADDVPLDLAPATADLLAFWPARSGQMTPAAWDRMMGEARKILEDPRGGIEILRGQLQEGIDAGIDGKRWQSLKFKNWEQFGTKAGGLVKASPAASRRFNQDEAAAQAVAYIKAREARKAADAAGIASQQTVLCEVIR
jgi:hypothetical protein